MENFIRSNAIQKLTEFDMTTAEFVYGDNIEAVFLITDINDPNRKKLEDLFNSVSKKMRTNG